MHVTLVHDMASVRGPQRGAGTAGGARAALHAWFSGVVQEGTSEEVVEGLTDVFVKNGCVSIAGLAEVTDEDVVRARSTPWCLLCNTPRGHGIICFMPFPRFGCAPQEIMVPALITRRRIIAALHGTLGHTAEDIARRVASRAPGGNLGPRV